MRSLRDRPEPLSSTSPGMEMPLVASQSSTAAWPPNVVAGRPDFSAAIVSSRVRAMTLLECLFTSRMISASVSDS